MLNIIKDSFQITNKYIVLATPLILFSLISTLYFFFSMSGNIYSQMFALSLLFLMTCAFLSGWFYMIKKAVAQHEETDLDDTYTLISDFPSGIGEYFLPLIGAFIVSIILALVFIAISYYAGIKTIGHMGISIQALSAAFANTESLNKFMLSLSQEQLTKLLLWNFLMLISTIITYFILMLYPQTLMYKEKNPIKALFDSIKSLFSKKFFSNFIIFSFAMTVYIVISISTQLFSANTFSYFVFTIIKYYSITYLAVLMFYYYYKNFIRFDKTI